MPQKLNVAVSQSRTRDTLVETLDALERITRRAASQGAHILLFPEGYLGGYPRGVDFGAVIGSRKDSGREQFLHYYNAAVDLGDTPVGAGDVWVDRELPVAKGKTYRGDGTREFLERVARETNILVITGVIEKAGGSLYCSVVYVDPKRGVLGKRRKVMPTGSERLVWAQGSPSTLKAVTTEIRGVKLTLAAAICWENFMPLLRQSIYAQNVNLYLAPTADARDTWLPLMQTVAFESRAVVLSCNQCVWQSQLPAWVRQSSSPTPQAPSKMEVKDYTAIDTREERPSSPNGDAAGTHASLNSKCRRHSVITEDEHEITWADPKSNSYSLNLKQSARQLPPIAPTSQSESHDPYLSAGGSCIISPFGKVLAGPVWGVSDEDESSLQVVEVDFEECIKGRLDLDVAGSYSRNDAFKLTVEGLDLSPPPL